MANKTYQGRIVQKHDTSANWAKATNFIPLKGEIIIYDDLNKIKIGDGTTNVNDLGFSDNKILIDIITTEKVDETSYPNSFNIMSTEMEQFFPIILIYPWSYRIEISSSVGGITIPISENENIDILSPIVLDQYYEINDAIYFFGVDWTTSCMISAYLHNPGERWIINIYAKKLIGMDDIAEYTDTEIETIYNGVE